MKITGYITYHIQPLWNIAEVTDQVISEIREKVNSYFLAYNQ